MLAADGDQFWFRFGNGTHDVGGHGCRARREAGRGVGGQRCNCELGGELGIALAGSILAGSYSHHIAAGLTAFAEPVRGPASDSLAKALEVANRLGPHGKQLAEVSRDAFVAAMNSSFLVMAVVGIAAVLVPLFASGRNGEQLRAVRPLREFRDRGRS